MHFLKDKRLADDLYHCGWSCEIKKKTVKHFNKYESKSYGREELRNISSIFFSVFRAWLES